jgi:trk system potassium uptake protein TrkH
MTTGDIALVYAVRLPVVGKYLGQLALTLAILTAVPAAVAVVDGEHAVALRYGIVMGGLILGALPTLRLPAPAHVQSNEALLIVALTFLAAALLMSYPMMAAGLSFADALFEAISGITTTGLTTVQGIEEKSRSFLFVRAWMQWYGGLGIAVLSVALLMGHHMAARRLMEPVTGEPLVTTARTYARHILIVDLALTLAGIGMLWFLLDDALLAILHTLSSVSTGGFSPYSASLAGLDSWTARFTVMAFALCGALPLIVYYRATERGWRAIAGDVEVQALTVTVTLVVVVLSLLMATTAGGGGTETLLHACLLGISAQTGTGFSSMTVGDLDDASKLVLILSMFVGGGVGSTAGGIKLLRLVILLRLLQLMLRRTALSDHAVMKPRLAGRPLEDEDLQRAMLVILLFTTTIAVSWLGFVAFGHAPLDALFEVVSATATAGLSTGITGSGLHPLLKTVLCVDMLLGRLEIVALLVILYPRTWIGKRANSQ